MKAHEFQDTDADGLCDYVTDFPALERRCLQGKDQWPHRLADALTEMLPADWNGGEK